jgi:hypothetical protein
MVFSTLPWQGPKEDLYPENNKGQYLNHQAWIKHLHTMHMMSFWHSMRMRNILPIQLILLH